MEPFTHYKVKKMDSGYEIVLYFNNDNVEFSKELGTLETDKDVPEGKALQYIKKRFPDIHIRSIKITASAIIVSTLGFAGMFSANTAEAAGESNAQAQTQTTSIHTVVSGDTLWNISTRYGTSVDEIKTMNQLRTDVLQIGQQLNVPNRNAAVPSSQNGTQAVKTEYKVVAGDTLWRIANRFGTNVDNLMKMNNLRTDVLQIGQRLEVPTMGTGSHPTQTNSPTVQTEVYTVVAGDNLWRIANRFGTTVDEILQMNNLTSNVLQIGQRLTVPAQGSVAQPVSSPDTQQVSSITQAELEWLAKMIHAESRGESLAGQIAVGAVIMNRVKSSLFPNTVREVLFERSNGIFQFTPASNGSLNNATPDSRNMEAAIRAANGEDPTNGSLYFYNPAKTGDTWIRTRTVSTTIGNHVFAY
ncbi:LysM peptidoglycan-binding domain-containing protein [Evansella tamaricis]|uniref:LysM peptidoglycan-binding domain-containing protein n=1 Tax=Evansella tamaricis TaxID=2069301 RepID=A0ABS6JKP2_9BACI|nr:LysM peptidoglycan-binding domain-containing protein [Evansella tamaricis]MBU9713392.1 LysM peptidoglycan-binding domain-containing protein [Evansella tamaricis]